MNRTKIEWTDYSCSAVTGCLHGCWYCYARKLFHRFHRSFEPTFHPERLKEPWKLKKPSKIFMCSVSDLFAPWTPKEWRNAVLEAAWNCPVKHSFQFLTKNPELIPSWPYPSNFWIGTTVTNINEARNVREIKKVQCGIRFVSFEPLLGPVNLISLRGVDWVIIGKLTGSRRIQLKREWVEPIILECKSYRPPIPIFMKNNLVPTFSKNDLIQEFPKTYMDQTAK